MSAGFMSAAALLSIAFAQNSSRKSEEFRK